MKEGFDFGKDVFAVCNKEAEIPCASLEKEAEDEEIYPREEEFCAIVDKMEEREEEG